MRKHERKEIPSLRRKSFSSRTRFSVFSLPENRETTERLRQVRATKRTKRGLHRRNETRRTRRTASLRRDENTRASDEEEEKVTNPSEQTTTKFIRRELVARARQLVVSVAVCEGKLAQTRGETKFQIRNVG